MFDLVIIGAGPIGLEVAILAKRAGLNYLVVEKGSIVEAIRGYPTYMTFFTTSERLEIGGHPLITSTDKPTRKEALDYYRKVVQNEALNIHTHTEVTGIERQEGQFAIRVKAGKSSTEVISARKVVLATGYFDNPKLLGVPGEDRKNVSHFYTEAHPFYNRNITIIGAGSSAADAALDLFHGGAKVTIVHRGSDFRSSLKYWIRPNLENRVKEGAIAVHFDTVVREIQSRELVAEKDGATIHIATDQTFVLTGYFASPELLNQPGASYDPVTYAVTLTDNFETTVPGLYVVGSAGYGMRTSDVFIENGIVHAAKAVQHITTAD